MKIAIGPSFLCAALLGVTFLPACSSSDSKEQPGARTDGGVSGDGGAVDRSPCVPDESVPVPTDRCVITDGGAAPAGGPPKCNEWIKVDIPGAVCGDGSQYKIFVNYSNTSNDLAVNFEPGGACWDYESCSGAGGIRGAANPHGIPDDHMNTYGQLNLQRRTDANPMKDWNMVFVPYCTGDVHTGNNVMTYQDPTGQNPDLEFHHAGHDNTMKVVQWMADHFETIPRLMVNGCSAGGAGAILNYHFIRQGLTGAQCGYLLDDSGPIFHSDGPSKQLHQKIRSAWNVDSILDGLAGTLPVSVADLKKDFGLINVATADKYPHDRLTLVLYRMDFNYSLYSYQRFFPGSTEADIHRMWWEDLQALMTTYDTRSNLAYFIPYFRTDNCSHCVTIPPIGHDLATILGQPWLGSEIQQKNIDLHQYTVDLLDPSKPLESYVEDVQPTESFTPDESASCMKGG